MTSFNPHRDVPRAPTQPAPYSCRPAHVPSAVLVCSGSTLIPHRACSEQSITSKDKASILCCLQLGTSVCCSLEGKQQGTFPANSLRAVRRGRSQRHMLAGRHQLGDCPPWQAPGRDPFSAGSVCGGSPSADVPTAHSAALWRWLHSERALLHLRVLVCAFKAVCLCQWQLP